MVVVRRTLNIKERAYRVGLEDEYYKYIIAKEKYEYLKDAYFQNKVRKDYVDENHKDFLALSDARTEYFTAKGIIFKVEKLEQVLEEKGELYNDEYPEPGILFHIRDKCASMMNRSELFLNYTQQGARLKETAKESSKMVAVIAVVIIVCNVLMSIPQMVQAYHILNGSEYVINGTVTHNSGNAKMMYMGYNDTTDPNGKLTIDSAEIVDNKFIFQGKTQYSERTYLSTTLHNIYYTYPEKTAILYIEPRNEVSCVINLEHPYDSIKVYNSSADKDFRYMMTNIAPLEERRSKLCLQLDSAYKIGDTVQISKLNEEIYIANCEYSSGWLNLALSLDKNSSVAFDSYVSILLGNESLTLEEFLAIENRFSQVPWYIKDCKSGQRVAKTIKSKK